MVSVQLEWTNGGCVSPAGVSRGCRFVAWLEAHWPVGRAAVHQRRQQRDGGIPHGPRWRPKGHLMNSSFFKLRKLYRGLSNHFPLYLKHFQVFCPTMLCERPFSLWAAGTVRVTLVCVTTGGRSCHLLIRRQEKDSSTCFFVKALTEASVSPKVSEGRQRFKCVMIQNKVRH